MRNHAGAVEPAPAAKEAPKAAADAGGAPAPAEDKAGEAPAADAQPAGLPRAEFDPADFVEAEIASGALHTPPAAVGVWGWSRPCELPRVEFG